jgi:hypothetical protein
MAKEGSLPISTMQRPSGHALMSSWLFKTGRSRVVAKQIQKGLSALVRALDRVVSFH